VALVLAIAAWVVCPLIPAIIAVVLAGQSDRAIAASGGALDGRSMNTATRWVAWANIAFWGIMVVVLGIILLWAANQGSGISFDGSTQF
jgi:hypothetical protein